MNKNLVKQNIFYHIKDKQFYNVDGFYGDPEGAISAGYEYMVDEFLHVVDMNENGVIKSYSLKNNYPEHKNFFDFYITREEAMKMLNKKLKKIKK